MPLELTRPQPAAAQWFTRILTGLMLTTASMVWAQQATNDNPSGPIRLRAAPVDRPATGIAADRPVQLGNVSRLSPMDLGGDVRREPRGGEIDLPPLDEFEAHVTRQAIKQADGRFGAPARPLEIRRLGTDLVTGGSQDASEDAQPMVPPDYVISPGDELQVLLWGSVDADLRLVVDRTGRISVPRIGAILVAGVRYADLQDLIGKRVGQVFRNYQLSVSLGQLRNVRVFVTGYVKRPGAYSVSALSTLLAAVVRAGGPAAAGSFRDIQLRRAGSPVAAIDLYDLMLRGDKSTDRMVQADDIIHVGPVGAQIGLIGSVNKAAVFEIKPGEKLSDVIAMAGGFSAIADRSRLSVERLDDRQGNRVTELAWPRDAALAPQNGDVLRAFSAVEAVLPLSQQNKRIRIEGEVLRPGEYVVPASTSTSAILRQAGGLTANSYIYATEFTRESVRLTQQINYERAVRDLEASFAKSSGTQRALDAGEAAAQAQQAIGNQRLIDKLKEIKPTGRIVFQIAPDATELPDLPLEDGDRIYIPPKASTVGVFGSVFSVGSYLASAGKNVGDFLSLAGGPTRGADSANAFVIRPNGSVVSHPQKAGFFGYGAGLNDETTQAGDTIFVPEEINKTTLVQGLKEWSTIFFNFGLGAAAVKTLR